MSTSVSRRKQFRDWCKRNGHDSFDHERWNHWKEQHQHTYLLEQDCGLTMTTHGAVENAQATLTASLTAGNKLFAAGKFQNARDKYCNALSVDLSNADRWVVNEKLGDVAYKLGEHAIAAKCYSQTGLWTTTCSQESENLDKQRQTQKSSSSVCEAYRLLLCRNLRRAEIGLSPAACLAYEDDISAYASALRTEDDCAVRMNRWVFIGDELFRDKEYQSARAAYKKAWIPGMNRLARGPVTKKLGDVAFVDGEFEIAALLYSRHCQPEYGAAAAALSQAKLLLDDASTLEAFRYAAEAFRAGLA